jgi:hypothetical protein
VDPAVWAELKVAQTARAPKPAGGRGARPRPGRSRPPTRRSPGTGRRPDQEAAAALEAIRTDVNAAWAGLDRRAEAEAERAAEVDEAGINESVIQAATGAAAALGSAWEPGSAPAGSFGTEHRPEASADTELEI